MAERAEEFVSEWIEENVAREVRDGGANPPELASACRTAAQMHGITDDEIRLACGDLEARMAEAIRAQAS